jgi:hypothetical protein
LVEQIEIGHCQHTPFGPGIEARLRDAPRRDISQTTPVSCAVGGHEILPGGGHERARWWPAEIGSPEPHFVGRLLACRADRSGRGSSVRVLVTGAGQGRCGTALRFVSSLGPVARPWTAARRVESGAALRRVPCGTGPGVKHLCPVAADKGLSKLAPPQTLSRGPMIRLGGRGLGARHRLRRIACQPRTPDPSTTRGRAAQPRPRGPRRKPVASRRSCGGSVTWNGDLASPRWGGQAD